MDLSKIELPVIKVQIENFVTLSVNRAVDRIWDKAHKEFKCGSGDISPEELEKFEQAKDALCQVISKQILQTSKYSQ